MIVLVMNLITRSLQQWESKVEEGQKNFDKASKTLKKEVQTFEVNDFYFVT